MAKQLWTKLDIGLRQVHLWNLLFLVGLSLDAIVSSNIQLLILKNNILRGLIKYMISECDSEPSKVRNQSPPNYAEHRYLSIKTNLEPIG